MTKPPACISHARFYENRFKSLARCFAFDFESLAKETVNTRFPFKTYRGTTAWAFFQILDSVYAEISRRGRFVFHRVAASAAQRWRISSSTSPGFATV